MALLIACHYYDVKENRAVFWHYHSNTEQAPLEITKILPKTYPENPSKNHLAKLLHAQVGLG